MNNRDFIHIAKEAKQIQTYHQNACINQTFDGREIESIEFISPLEGWPILYRCGCRL